MREDLEGLGEGEEYDQNIFKLAPWQWAKRHLVGGGVLISVRGRADGSPLFILA